MNRVTTVSTFIGLLGLAVAMFAALAGAFVTLIALGFALMTLGIMGAVVGAAASLTRAWHSTR